jgi:formylmethanofuran dehydrogenase subunit C
MKIRTLLLTLFMIVGLAACNRDNVTSVERSAEGGVDVTVKLTEQEVNEAITTVLAVSANPLLRNPTVDLQAGQIVVNGEHERRDGQGKVTGSITITVAVQDGLLLPQITQADIEDFDLSDARVAEFNQRLQADFNRRANRDNKQLTFKSVAITDSDLEIVFNFKR